MFGLHIVRLGILGSVASAPLLGGCVDRTVYVDRPVYRPAPVVVTRPAPVVVTPAPAPVVVQQPAVPAAPEYQPDATVVVAQPAPMPPAVTEVITVSPGPEFVWIPGYYEYYGTRYVWVGGHWGRPVHPHAVWVRGGWQHVHGGYRWERGHWH